MEIVVTREACSAAVRRALTFYRWLGIDKTSIRGIAWWRFLPLRSSFRAGDGQVVNSIKTKSTRWGHLHIGRFGVDTRPPNQWRALQRVQSWGLAQEFVVHTICWDSADPGLERTGMKPAEKLVFLRYGSKFFYFLKMKKTQLAFLVRKYCVVDKRSSLHPSAKILNAELSHLR